MFCYQCLIDRVGTDDRRGGCAYHIDLAAQLPPRRVAIEISDLGQQRAWVMSNFFFDLRSGGSASDVAIPDGKQRAPNMSESRQCELKLARSTIGAPTPTASIEIGISWPDAHAAVARNEPNAQ